ncbi:hypothetical protein J4232_00155 [Candidatus Woesearchaeota archaeon]|nr:hypothetical protein [Candidatus Woesearchaeota archaeon]
MPSLQEDISFIRKELETSKKPLFLFDDDPDGLTSFLLLYRKIQRGKGIFIKSSPNIEKKYLKQVQEYGPDKIFILDMPIVEQEFIDGALQSGVQKILWIDHHEPQKNTGVYYLNPRNYIDADNRPTNYWAYLIVQQDQWIAIVGCLSDWFLPEFAAEFSSKYPEMLPSNITKVDEALFTTKIGGLSRIFSFILKGKSDDAKKCIKILTRLEHFDEVLHQTTAQGKFVYQKFEAINKEYLETLDNTKNAQIVGNLLLYKYSEMKTSFTSDLSNELLFKNPGKAILICREKSGEMKCSMRGANYDLPTIIHKSLEGLQGYGGGHTHACGVCVKLRDWDVFLERVKKEIES